MSPLKVKFFTLGQYRILKRFLNVTLSKYLAEENEDGILKYGCFHKPAGIGVNESLIWGDYYFIEAIMKYKSGERWNTKGKG